MQKACLIFLLSIVSGSLVAMEGEAKSSEGNAVSAQLDDLNKRYGAGANMSNFNAAQIFEAVQQVLTIPDRWVDFENNLHVKNSDQVIDLNPLDTELRNISESHGHETVENIGMARYWREKLRAIQEEPASRNIVILQLLTAYRGD
jgi:hypothetical protein